MRTTKRASRLLLLVVMLTLAACASSGKPAPPPPACPVMPELPQRLLKRTDYASQVRQEFFEQPSSPKPSETKPSSDMKPLASPKQE